MKKKIIIKTHPNQYQIQYQPSKTPVPLFNPVTLLFSFILGAVMGMILIRLFGLNMIEDVGFRIVLDSLTSSDPVIDKRELGELCIWQTVTFWKFVVGALGGGLLNVYISTKYILS